jgi:hypothetical protein
MVVSFAGCANCSNSLRIFSSQQNLFRNTILLSDPRLVNKEQLINISIENFGVHFGKYLLDEKLYERFTNGSIPKLPYFIVTKGQEVLLKLRVDSLANYRGLVSFFDELPQKALSKTYKNNRLSQIGGYADLAIKDQYAFVKYFNKGDRVYIYDLLNGSLDSIYFSKNATLLKQLLKQAGDTLTNPAATIEFFEQYGLPFNLFQFGKGNATKEGFMFSNNLLYVNVDEIDTLISPTWIQYLVDYQVENKKTTFFSLKNWHDTLLRPKSFMDYMLDDYAYYKIDSLHYRASAKFNRAKQEGKAEIAFVDFKLEANGLVPVAAITFPEMFLKDFKNAPLLKEYYVTQLNYENGFLFFNESPQYNLHGNWYSFDTFNLNLKWILDAKLIPETNIIQLAATNNSNQSFLFYLDLTNQKVIHQVKLKLGDYKSNSVLNGNRIYYLDKEGRMNVLGLK